MVASDLTPKAAIKNPIVTAVVALLLGGGGVFGFTTLDDVKAEAATTAITNQRIATLERELDDTQLRVSEELGEMTDALNNNTTLTAILVERIDAQTALIERLHR